MKLSPMILSAICSCSCDVLVNASLVTVNYIQDKSLFSLGSILVSPYKDIQKASSRIF